MTEPDLREWAKAILFMAREGQPASEKLVDAVEYELKEIAQKYMQLGDDNTWWKKFDNHIRIKK